MENHLRLAALLIALGCVALALGQTTAPASEQKPEFTMTISLRQTTVKPGSEVNVGVDLTNISGKPISIYLSRSGKKPYAFSVVDATGKSARLTPLGRAIQAEGDVVRDENGRPTRFLGSHTGGWVAVAPGGTLHDDMPLSNSVDLGQPGEYKIRLQRTDPATRLTVTSNTVTLIVAN